MPYRLSSFNDVAKAYADIKPIKGARIKEDLRPLNQRRYWWNRIIKVNDNKYLLCDGHWAWQNMTDDVREQTCPIMWERKDDGDFITIRNHMNDGISVSRYTFLQSHLPIGMHFHYDNGKHFVNYVGKDHYLPKFKGLMDWSNHIFKMEQDNKIVFKHVDNGVVGQGYIRVNELQPYKTRRIDKELDAQYYPKIQDLYAWMQVVLPVLGETLISNRSEYANKLLDTGYGGYWYWQRYVNPLEVRQILDDPEHEKRMALAVILANEAEAYHQDRFAVKIDTFKRMHKVIRKVANFVMIEQR
jgi:hypothetical protein